MHSTEEYRYDAYNPEIYSLIGKGKKVLDVGCATGRLGEKLKKEKECYVVGIEIDKKMAEVAKLRCDQVIIADAEELQELPFPQKFFDVITFGDSLEHMRYPAKVLVKLRDYLSDDGYILASIPNIAFITKRLKLLLGIFNYGEYGILDKTHLRFFTLKTAKKLIEESGYKIISIKGYWYVRKRYALLKIAGRIWKTLFAINFIMKAIKK